MVKLKYNADKDSYSLKGLSYDNLALIAGLVGHTRLGLYGLPEAAFEISNLLQVEGVIPCEVELDIIDEDGYFELIVAE